MFPRVLKGDRFVPRADWYNKTLDLIDEHNRGPEQFDPNLDLRRHGQVLARIENLEPVDLPCGCAVWPADANYSLSFPLYSVKRASGPDFWILSNGVKSASGGFACVAGCAVVEATLRSPSDLYLESRSGELYGSDAGVRILSARHLGSNRYACAVLLGTSPSAETPRYTGSFAVTAARDADTGALFLSVGPGYVNCNGLVHWNVPATVNIPPRSGTLCVCTGITSSGEWMVPEVKFAEASLFRHPVAEIEYDPEEDDGKGRVSIRQYPLTVVLILAAKECPAAKEF